MQYRLRPGDSFDDLATLVAGSSEPVDVVIEPGHYTHSRQHQHGCIVTPPGAPPLRVNAYGATLEQVADDDGDYALYRAVETSGIAWRGGTLLGRGRGHSEHTSAFVLVDCPLYAFADARVDTVRNGWHLIGYNRGGIAGRIIGCRSRNTQRAGIVIHSGQVDLLVSDYVAIDDGQGSEANPDARTDAAIDCEPPSGYSHTIEGLTLRDVTVRYADKPRIGVDISRTRGTRVDGASLVNASVHGHNALEARLLDVKATLGTANSGATLYGIVMRGKVERLEMSDIAVTNPSGYGVKLESQDEHGTNVVARDVRVSASAVGLNIRGVLGRVDLTRVDVALASSTPVHAVAVAAKASLPARLLVADDVLVTAPEGATWDAGPVVLNNVSEWRINDVRAPEPPSFSGSTPQPSS